MKSDFLVNKVRADICQSLQIFIFFGAHPEEKMLTPKVYLQILSMQSFFSIF